MWNKLKPKWGGKPVKDIFLIKSLEEERLTFNLDLLRWKNVPLIQISWGEQSIFSLGSIFL